jgi:hypothetical protein
MNQTLPTPAAYQYMSEKLQAERPLCAFYFVLDGSPDTAHKVSYGFAGGGIPMVWLDLAANSMSQLVEWEAVLSLTPGSLNRAKSMERIKFNERGYLWLGSDRGHVRSLIVGEEFMISRDGTVADPAPCSWLLSLARQSAENSHHPVPSHPEILDQDGLENPSTGTWPVEFFEPTVRKHVIKGEGGTPDVLIVGLVIRSEKQGELTNREGTDFAVVLSATSDDPQTWSHLEYFAVQYECFYEKQVQPFIGRPIRGYPAIDCAFYSIEDFAGIGVGAELPPGESQSVSQEQMHANIEAFIHHAAQ